MTSPRDRQLSRVSSALGRNSLLWFGIRGDDALPLLRLEQFQDCFAIAAPITSTALRTNESLEAVTGVRVDLDAYDIDEDPRPMVDTFRRSLMACLNTDSLILNYRPSHFISNIGFAMHGTTRALGMFKDRQSAYEYKPWVETELARRNIQTIPWQYVADEFRQRAAATLANGPRILRISRSSGGAGIVLVRTAEELEAAWPSSKDHLVAVGPYLDRAIPLNVGAVVHEQNTVRVHPGSVQLIGIPQCTPRPFGYCGNDMAAFAAMGKGLAQLVDNTVRRIGHWLGQEGYLGAFGVDFLLQDGQLYFSEVNARLQGSTALSSDLAADSEHVDIVVDHLSALLGIGNVESLSLMDWCEEVPPASQVIVHNLLDHQVQLQEPGPLWELGSAGFEPQLIPKAGTRIDPGAVLVRLAASRQVTTDGFKLTPDLAWLPARVASAFSEVPDRPVLSP